MFQDSSFLRIALAGFLLATAPSVRARSLFVPNASFESPSTTFVDNRVDAWQKTPKPFWYDESGGFTWDQLGGVFKNTEPGKEDHLENADGAQAFYFFAVPSVGLYLDGTSTNAATPFVATFEPGQSYTLTLAVQGGGGGMTNGVTLELGLYYRDSGGSPQTVASTVITHDPTTFPSRQRLVDFTVRTPPVKATDPWAGQGIGIQVLSTVNPAWVGGYWNIDNARLDAYPSPQLRSPAVVDGRFGFLVQSEPGLKFDVLGADHALATAADWTTVGTITNLTGSAEFSAPLTAASPRFYRVRQIP